MSIHTADIDLRGTKARKDNKKMLVYTTRALLLMLQGCQTQGHLVRRTSSREASCKTFDFSDKWVDRSNPSLRYLFIFHLITLRGLAQFSQPSLAQKGTKVGYIMLAIPYPAMDKDADPFCV